MGLVSALVTKGVDDGLKLYTNVELVTAFTTPDGELPAGSKGFVEFIDPENGTVELFMEGRPPALYHWANILVLVPFQTDDLAECVRATFPKRTTETQDKIRLLHDNTVQVA
jgi:hypothetical protein